jgi:Zn-dependent protease
MRLFKIRGIQLELHWTFLLLLLFFGAQGYGAGGLIAALMSVGAVCLIFFCVILHELGHSFMALHYGIRIYRILLLPIGGMAQFASIPQKPKEELWITIAGPAVNFALAGISWLVIKGGALQQWSDPYELSFLSIMHFVFMANIAMGLFNILPIFPMDGGRIFRAILAFMMPYTKATQIAVNLGKGLAVIGIALAVVFWQNFMLGLLFLFVFFVSDQELQAVTERDLWEKAMKGGKVDGLQTPPAEKQD